MLNNARLARYQQVESGQTRFVHHTRGPEITDVTRDACDAATRAGERRLYGVNKVAIAEMKS